MTGFSEDPQAPYGGAPRDKRSFLHWVQRQEGRFEFKDGRVEMHAGSTRRHAWISVGFAAALSQRLDPAIWTIGSADIAVEIGEDIRSLIAGRVGFLISASYNRQRRCRAKDHFNGRRA